MEGQATSGGVARLETPRLRLRPLESADAGFVLELLNEPGWKRYIGDRGVDSLASARAYLENGPWTSYHRHGFGLLVVERRDDGAALGLCGLLQRDDLDAPDLGYALLARHEGRGYAREAATAVVAWARRSLRVPRLFAFVTADNARSIHLLECLGFRRERPYRQGAETLDLFALDLGDPSASPPP